MARDACFEKTALSIDVCGGHQKNEVYAAGNKGLAEAAWSTANERPIEGFDPESCDGPNQLRFTVIGLIFLVFGIFPGVHLGRSAALAILGNLPGGAISSTWLVKAAIIAGIGAGIICAAAISVVVAGLLCAAVDYLAFPSVARGERRSPVRREQA
ncbi:MAG TPA: hypothetical protein VF903_06805 [Nitrospirota bacterium]